MFMCFVCLPRRTRLQPIIGLKSVVFLSVLIEVPQQETCGSKSVRRVNLEQHGLERILLMSLPLPLPGLNDNNLPIAGC